MSHESTEVNVRGPHFSVLMVDHNVVRLDVAMHNALAVAEVESFEEFENVEADVEIVELGVEAAEVGVVHVLEDERWRFALMKSQSATRFDGRQRDRTNLRVSNNVEESNDIGSARQVLQDLDLSLDLLLLDRLENLDDALLVVDDIDAFKDFRVLSTTYRRTRGQ